MDGGIAWPYDRLMVMCPKRRVLSSSCQIYACATGRKYVLE
jgi:hypothetical protein